MHALLHTSLPFVKLKVSHGDAILMHCVKRVPSRFELPKQASVGGK